MCEIGRARDLGQRAAGKVASFISPKCNKMQTLAQLKQLQGKRQRQKKEGKRSKRENKRENKKLKLKKEKHKTAWQVYVYVCVDRSAPPAPARECKTGHVKFSLCAASGSKKEKREKIKTEN